ncbi:MAG: NAD(P)/FAD-dependent oxidoreductase [Anaerolineae bacterium]
MGPLRDGQTAVIIGGGPGGTACGLALLKLAHSLGRRIRVILYDGKAFVGETHYNQCVGVLSPPIQSIMAQLNVPFPHHLVQREVHAYVLHGEGRQIRLTEAGEPSYALRRVQFDAYMLDQARAHGVEVRESRVTDLEFLPDRVNVYAEGTNCRASVVFGAFGLDSGTATTLAQATSYRPPRFLTSLVTKVHPPPEAMSNFGDDIHAFLPRNPAIEFGAVTPKGNHLTVNIAGAHIDSRDIDAFLAYPPLRRLLHFADPACPYNPKDFVYYRGRFPISVARSFYGNRYACLGDAAGLVRAFKGKGVNSACQTALWAAETALTVGVSRRAFDDHYRRACRLILTDLPYGKAMRRLVIVGSRLGLVDRLIAAADHEPTLQRALFDAVSAHRPYRTVAAEVFHPPALARLIYAFARPGFRRTRVSHAAGAE